jgi:hypothetical protein
LPIDSVNNLVASVKVGKDRKSVNSSQIWPEMDEPDLLVITNSLSLPKPGVNGMENFHGKWKDFQEGCFFHDGVENFHDSGIRMLRIQTANPKNHSEALGRKFLPAWL